MQDSASVSGNTNRGGWGGDISFCGLDRAFIYLDRNLRATHLFNRQNGILITQGNALVSDNTALHGGGGVFFYEPSVIFTMQGNATVSGNTSRIRGGGGVLLVGLSLC